MPKIFYNDILPWPFAKFVPWYLSYFRHTVLKCMLVMPLWRVSKNFIILQSRSCLLCNMLAWRLRFYDRDSAFKLYYIKNLEIFAYGLSSPFFSLINYRKNFFLCVYVCKSLALLKFCHYMDNCLIFKVMCLFREVY